MPQQRWFDWKPLILRTTHTYRSIVAAALRVLVRARHLGVRGQRWGKPHQVPSANHHLPPPNIFPQTGGFPPPPSISLNLSHLVSISQRVSVGPKTWAQGFNWIFQWHKGHRWGETISNHIKSSTQETFVIFCLNLLSNLGYEWGVVVSIGINIHSVAHINWPQNICSVVGLVKNVVILQKRNKSIQCLSKIFWSRSEQRGAVNHDWTFQF